MNKDWTGDKNSVYKTLGASNHTEKKRAENDYYATDPKALELLLEHEKFNHYVWECAVGGGHLAKILEEKGFDVKASDIIDRGYPNTKIINFLEILEEKFNDRDIITNPPYKYAQEFVEQALKISVGGGKNSNVFKTNFFRR